MRGKVTVPLTESVFAKTPFVFIRRIIESLETEAEPLVAISVSGTSTVDKVSYLWAGSSLMAVILRLKISAGLAGVKLQTYWPTVKTGVVLV